MVGRLDEVQYQSKADLFDKIKWAIGSVIIAAITTGIIAAIVNSLK